MKRYADFFDAESHSAHPADGGPAARPSAPASSAADNKEIRAMVWQGLVGLGVPAGQEELVILAELLGSALYQGPLLDTISATELLRRTGAGQWVTEIAHGASVALAIRADGCASPAELAPMMVGGDGTTIDAQRCFVGFASEVDYVIVVGAPTLALVVRDQSTVALRRYEETGRGELFDIRLAGTPVTTWLGGVDDWQQVLANARIRQAAYLVGLSQGALDLAVGYAKKRRQFGQPIGRFQSLAFRLSG